MKTVLIALALVAATIGSASAGVMCTRFGNTVMCSGNGQTTTCTTFGNITTCY